MSDESSTLQDVAVVNEESVQEEAAPQEAAQTGEPAAEVEAQPESTETGTESGEVEESTPEVEESVVASGEPEVSQSDKIRKLLRKLDVPEKPNEKLLESIDEDSIDRLPQNIRGLFKHLVAAQRQQLDAQTEQMKQRIADLDAREEQIAAKARDLIRNRAHLNRVLTDPKLQKLIEGSEVPDDQLADPYSEEGIQQRIQRGVAQAMKAFQAPITEAAQRAQQMSAYQDFVESHPLMKQKAFKSEVRQIMEERKTQGAQISLEDAYNLADRNRMLKGQQAAQQKERAARSASARKVQRSTQSSQPGTGDPVPNWVMEKGYDGARGSLARIKYLRDNPDALAKLREQQRRR